MALKLPNGIAIARLAPSASHTTRLHCLMLGLLFSFPLTVKAQTQEQTAVSAQEELQQMKAASGGSKWDAVKLITAEGEKKSFGLAGKYHSTEELGTGFFERRADYGLFANAEGLDRAGRWRQDNSGHLHALNSDEARAVATSDAYLARRGYLFPERAAAKFRTLEPADEGKKQFHRVEVTPQDGRAVELWIDPATHLLDRVVMELSVGSKTVRYAEYRAAGGLLLPFEITSEYRDDADNGTARIAAYRVSTTTEENGPERPGAQFDARIVGGTQKTTAKGYLDSETGFYVVEAKIDNKGPFLFVLDTGGHNIVSSQFSHRHGLIAVGTGFATGAGAGSTKTQFTKVKSISIGAATDSDQAFTILQLDFPAVAYAGRRRPIVGIIGLEFFERFAITMGYGTRTVTVQPLSSFTCQGDALAVPIFFTSDMPLGVAALDGHTGPFAIDTGNNTDLIVFRHWALSNQLADKYAKGDSMNGDSVGGSIDLKKARAESFQIGGKELGPISILLAPENAGSLSSRSEAGNIGNSILSHFKAVTFDYGSGIMCLQR